MKHCARYVSYFFFIFILFTGLQCSPAFEHHMNQFHYRAAAPYSNFLGRTIPVVVDNRFGEADKVSIQQALDQWNYALNGRIILQVQDWSYDMNMMETNKLMQQSGLIIMLTDSNNLSAPTSKPGYYTIAWASKVRGHVIYLIRDRVKNEDVKYVMLHEIGHIMGADHQSHDLMEPYYKIEDYQCVDLDTLKQVSYAQGLDWKQLRYCVYYND